MMSINRLSDDQQKLLSREDFFKWFTLQHRSHKVERVTEVRFSPRGLGLVLYKLDPKKSGDPSNLYIGLLNLRVQELINHHHFEGRLAFVGEHKKQGGEWGYGRQMEGPLSQRAFYHSDIMPDFGSDRLGSAPGTRVRVLSGRG